MQRVCAWCGKDFGASSEELAPDPITHGICDECRVFFATNRPESLRQFLSRFDVPILCVDKDGRVVTANEAACTLLGKAQNDVGDVLCGDVIQCRWARLPGGCGKTEHCLGCTIRLLVTATISGESVLGQPAYFERESEDGDSHRTNLVLSAERQGQLVLLRIDRFGPLQ